MAAQPDRELLAQTRQILADARELLDTEPMAGGNSPPGGETHGRGGVLSLYEQLRAGLERIEDVRLRQLLARLATNVEELQRLAADVDQIRGLRRAIEEL
jgi:hypothetical protein